MLFAIGIWIWIMKGLISESAEKKMNVKESKRDKGLKKRSKNHSSSSDCNSSAFRKPDAKNKNKNKSISSDGESDDDKSGTNVARCQVTM